MKTGEHTKTLTTPAKSPNRSANGSSDLVGEQSISVKGEQNIDTETRGCYMLNSDNEDNGRTPGNSLPATARLSTQRQAIPSLPQTT